MLYESVLNPYRPLITRDRTDKVIALQKKIREKLSQASPQNERNCNKKNRDQRLGLGAGLTGLTGLTGGVLTALTGTGRPGLAGTGVGVGVSDTPWLGVPIWFLLTSKASAADDAQNPVVPSKTATNA